MIKNQVEQKTTANRLAKETINRSVLLWLEHIHGACSHTEMDDFIKDDDNFCDIFHWISIDQEQLTAMTHKERVDFISCMTNQIIRVSNLMGGE